MIYRVTGESTVWVYSATSGEPQEVPARLAGAFVAGMGGGAWSDLPIPDISHPRARFWFTEDGWRRYGRCVAAAAAASGRALTEWSDARTRRSRRSCTGIDGRWRCCRRAAT